MNKIDKYGIIIGDEKISYNAFAYRFENNKFVLESSIEVVINKLHQDLSKKLSKSEMVLAEQYAAQRWQEECNYQKKITDRFALAEEQIKELPQNDYTIVDMVYSISSEMKYSPWGAGASEYYVIKKIDVVEGKKEESVKVYGNLYIEEKLIIKVMEEVSGREIALHGRELLLKTIDKTHCITIRVKSPYDEMDEWEESYYFPNNQKPNLPEDGISFWRWATKKEF